MKKFLILILAGLFVLAGCLPQTANYQAPAGRQTESPFTVVPQFDFAPEPTPTTTTAFLAPIPHDFSSNNIASPDTAIYAIGVSGTVYAIVTERATDGISMPEGITMIINLGVKNGQSQFGMIEMSGEKEMSFDGGGMAVLGNYYPAQSLATWYNENTDDPLVEEIKRLVEQINAKQLCMIPFTDPSPVRICRPLPTPTP